MNLWRPLKSKCQGQPNQAAFFFSPRQGRVAPCCSHPTFSVPVRHFHTLLGIAAVNPTETNVCLATLGPSSRQVNANHQRQKLQPEAVPPAFLRGWKETSLNHFLYKGLCILSAAADPVVFAILPAAGRHCCHQRQRQRGPAAHGDFRLGEPGLISIGAAPQKQPAGGGRHLFLPLEPSEMLEVLYQQR